MRRAPLKKLELKSWETVADDGEDVHVNAWPPISESLIKSSISISISISMACSSSRSVRIHDAFEVVKPAAAHESNDQSDDESNNGRPAVSEPTSPSFKHCLKKKLRRVFSEDYESMKVNNSNIFDPRGPIIHRWNKIFLVVCIASLFIDPLFFFLPRVLDPVCIDIGVPLEVRLTILRSLADIFYAIQIFIRFRTSFVAPSSRVFGRGELVIDPHKIALRYLSRGFCLDLIAAFPIPQFLIWVVIPSLDEWASNTEHVLLFGIFAQYLPRLYLIFPLSSQIIKITGVMTENAWAGAANNLMLYILASHVIGAAWYLQAIGRQESCWRTVCHLQSPSCQYWYFDCEKINDSRTAWFHSSNLTTLCKPSNNLIQYGIYGEAVQNGVTPSPFLEKYFYSFMWGLKNLSCLGQNLVTSPYISENIFAIIVSVLGLVLFGLLIGNMQSYLQSTTVRYEQWRVKRTDTEKWMHHRQLPPELKQCVRRYDVYKWVANQGVDEEALLKTLPLDLRKDIKRHLCLDLVRKVPLFDEMDNRMLDAICERLRPTLCTTGTCLVRELDPVKEVVFVVRGHLDSVTTHGGFNSCRLGPGDFCGEELLTWALDPCPSAALPSSTRTVKAVSEVEAFALVAEDLRFVAAQFHRLHSKMLRHKFRFYSHQWRTWAVCFIQTAWRRHRRRKESIVEEAEEEEQVTELRKGSDPQAKAAVFVSRLMARTSMKRREAGAARPDGGGGGGGAMMQLKKPTEPDFSVVERN